MKYSQKLQPGSVLFSLKVLMSSSNLPRFLVKDIRSNVLSLVRKAFQDSWVREESFKGSLSTTHLQRQERTIWKILSKHSITAPFFLPVSSSLPFLSSLPPSFLYSFFTGESVPATEWPPRLGDPSYSLWRRWSQYFITCVFKESCCIQEYQDSLKPLLCWRPLLSIMGAHHVVSPRVTGPEGLSTGGYCVQVSPARPGTPPGGTWFCFQHPHHMLKCQAHHSHAE